MKGKLVIGRGQSGIIVKSHGTNFITTFITTKKNAVVID